MRIHRSKVALIVLAFVSIFAVANPALAQSAEPPPAPGAWSEVVTSTGNIQYNNLTDGGVVQQQANWMPSIPLIGSLEAQYHVYYTPSGNKVLMPTASTLFFMAMNPAESGFNSAASTLGTNGNNAGESAPTGIAGVGAAIGALFNNAGSAQLMASINQAGYTGPSAASSYFQDVISGKQNIWSLNPAGLTNFWSSLRSQSTKDTALYTYMLLYTPGQCASTPGGCSAAQLAALATAVPPQQPTPPPSNCPGSSVKLGAISAGGQEVYPPFPLVVGQDPNKTGVTISAYASVAPTIYTYYTQEPDQKCVPGPGPNGYDCAGGHKEVVGYKCVQHTQSFSECIAGASASTSLSQASRDWILHTLSIRYPQAYIHQPYFSLGGSGCAWHASGSSLQIDDPGIWNISVSGRTSGTPVSGPRSFSRSGLDFKVWLKETAIVK